MARTVPVMPTEQPSNYNTSALFNATTKATADFLTNPPRFKGYATSAQALGTGTTFVPISLDSEEYDTDAGHSTVTNTSRYVVQVAGTYDITAILAFAVNGTGNRSVGITVNGLSPRGSVAQLPSLPTNSWCCGITCTTALAVGDYVEMIGWQTSGGNLNTSVTLAFGPSLTLKWISA